MKFFTVVFALATSAVMVMAAPTSETQLEARQVVGKCNGTRCEIGGSFYDCYRGTSCTTQAGAGDGKKCHVNSTTLLADCPGKGNWDGKTH